MSLVLSIVTVYRHSMREARYPSNLEEACISCRLYRDVQEDRAFMLEEIWSSEKDMQCHLKSDRYHTVLLVVEQDHKLVGLLHIHDALRAGVA